MVASPNGICGVATKSVTGEEFTKRGHRTLHYLSSLDGGFLNSFRGHRKEEERLSLHGASREPDLAERWFEGHSANGVESMQAVKPRRQARAV